MHHLTVLIMFVRCTVRCTSKFRVLKLVNVWQATDSIVYLVSIFTKEYPVYMYLETCEFPNCIIGPS